MFRKILPISLFALSAFFSSVFAQEIVGLDVIIRKFSITHDGFEMFDFDRKSTGVCAGSNPEEDNSRATAENAICFADNGTYVQCSGSKSIYEGKKYAFPNQLRYGQFDCGKPERGYINGPDRGDGGKYTISNNGNGCWSNPVYVTKGMVAAKLDYSECSSDEKAGSDDIERAINGRYCARPMPFNGDCYGDKLDEWYTDGKGGKRVNYLMNLRKEAGKNTYLVQYDYNSKTNWNGYSTQGYFPLDSFAINNLEGFSRDDMQSLDVWCPPSLIYTEGDWSDGDNKKWCGIWGDVGGNNYYKNTSAARKAVDEGTPVQNEHWGGKVPPEKLHVYSFTMAGSGEFKYVEGAGDIFEFVGDDDMWIFIDGELAADLGGTHLAAPAKIYIDEYAKDKRWSNGSKHAINFFYADRQTDGSNMKLRMALSDLAPPRFGAPYIMDAKTIIESDGSSKTNIYVNSELDLDIIKSFINSGVFPIIINKSGSDTEILAFKLEKIEGPDNQGSKGYMYTIYGEVCDKNGCGSENNNGVNRILNSGDSLSFNVVGGNITDAGYKDPGGFALPCSAEEDCSFYIRSKNGNAATTIVWARNTTQLPPIDFQPAIPDPDPRKPDFDMNIWFSGDPNDPNGAIAGGSLPSGGQLPNINTVWDPVSQTMVSNSSVANSNNSVSGFGTTGTAIPSNRAGELVITAYPNPTQTINGMTYSEWEKDEESQKLFGLPPGSYEGNVFGVADPSDPNNVGYTFVKNGFENESSVNGKIQVAPTRCISDTTQNEPRVNCLNFSLPAQQPFQLAVTVYDQLGNFVTQYRETISEQEFRNIVQAPNYIDGSGVATINKSEECVEPTNQNYGQPNVLTTNGVVKVNVNIYPFSKYGRRFGNGVYILKIDRVDLPYTGCVNSGGAAVKTELPFVRYHADTKFGWMRSGSK